MYKGSQRWPTKGLCISLQSTSTIVSPIFSFDKVYGCRHSLPDGIMREADVMIVGKSFLIRGYGDVSEGSAFAARGASFRILITKID